MAEEVMYKALVLSPECDKLALKLQDMRLKNLTAEQQGNLYCCRVKFVDLFVVLSRILFGLSREQLKEFSDNELISLAELISSKARPRAIASQIFAFGVPIVGWVAPFLLEESWHAWPYLRHKRHLKKACGEDYFPLKELKLKLSS